MPTVIMADIDLAQIGRARAQLPALEHRRPEIYG
jgi:predicted amidohydrolase